jgi:sulfur-oxidizing protein SoxB
MSELVADIRENEKPDAVIVVSHNGMDVDIKMQYDARPHF